MANSNRQNVIQREKNKKGNGTISKSQLISCYVVSAVIVIVCLIESQKPEVIAEENQLLYYVLSVLAVALSIFITVRNNQAKKSDKPAGPRLK